MLLNLKNLPLVENRQGLTFLPSGKLLINTINAHSYNTAQQDLLFAEALRQGDVLIPDGASIVKACRWLNAKSKPKERIAGWDLFMFEMEKLNQSGGKCFFMGSRGRPPPRIFRGGSSPHHRRPCPHGAISWRCR